MKNSLNKTFEVNAEHYILEMCEVDNLTQNYQNRDQTFKIGTKM